MKDHVTFISSAFNLTEVKENFINDCCFGEDLANWLITTLKEQQPDAEVEPEPLQEDWGWWVFVSFNGQHANIGLGPYTIDTVDACNGWMCFVEAKKPGFSLKHLFSPKAKQEAQEKAAAAKNLACLALHKALSTSDKFTEIRWHEEERFLKGDEDHWTPTPE
jgi:hypothetical protein